LDTDEHRLLDSKQQKKDVIARSKATKQSLKFHNPPFINGA